MVLHVFRLSIFARQKMELGSKKHVYFVGPRLKKNMDYMEGALGF